MPKCGLVRNLLDLWELERNFSIYSTQRGTYSLFFRAISEYEGFKQSRIINLPATHIHHPLHST